MLLMSALCLKVISNQRMSWALTLLISYKIRFADMWTADLLIQGAALYIAPLPTRFSWSMLYDLCMIWVLNKRIFNYCQTSVLFFTNGGIHRGYLSLLALHLSGTPRLKTGTSNLSCLLLDNCLYITWTREHWIKLNIPEPDWII